MTSATVADIPPAFVTSAYFADCEVLCPIEKAWRVLADYKAWNPSFAGATVTAVRGTPGTEGELVLINQDSVPYVMGEATPPFYTETIRVLLQRRIVWYVYSKEEDLFRNFVDFQLTSEKQGVRLSLCYYEQLRLSPSNLAAHRNDSQASYETLANVFKAYCEKAA